MLNKCMIIGRLGKDPEIKTVGQGSQCCRFSVATTEKWKDNQGQSKEKTTWHNCVAWGQKGVILDKYLSKGSLVYIEGKIDVRSWDDNDGKKRYSTDLVVDNFQFFGAPAKDKTFGAEPSFDSQEEIPF